jgi:hypothetical protein
MRKGVRISNKSVIPAQAGIQFVGLIDVGCTSWIPAFAGMTVDGWQVQVNIHGVSSPQTGP